MIILSNPIYAFNPAALIKEFSSFSKILGDIKVLQKTQQRDIESLYSHFQALDDGEDYQGYLNTFVDYDTKQTIADLKKGNNVFEKYTSINPYSEMESIFSSIQTNVNTQMEDVINDLSQSPTLDERGRSQLNHKQNAQLIHQTTISSAYERQQLETLTEFKEMYKQEHEKRVKDDISIKYLLETPAASTQNRHRHFNLFDNEVLR